jgi:predicted site-specific integrase-resolvase
MDLKELSNGNISDFEFFTPEQLSAKLQVARKTIKKWTLARRIPGQLKCGGRWRYNRVSVEKAILRGEFLNKVT